MEASIRKKNNARTASLHRSNVAPLQDRQYCQGKMDFWLFFAIFALSTFGLIMVLSASYYGNVVVGSDPLAAMRTQIVCYALGLVCMLLVANFKTPSGKGAFRVLFKMSHVVYLFAVALLILVLFVGKELNGAKRWLNFGISFQPAEFAKFALVTALASFIAKRHNFIGHFKSGFFTVFVPIMLIIGVICTLIFFQPNKSTAIIICACAIALYFVGGANMGHIITLAVCAITVALVLIFKDAYSSDRLEGYSMFSTNTTNMAYQVKQSIYAIASGGLFGTGLGMSKQKLLFLTYADSDYIFSIICEEFGLVGALLLIALFLFIFYRGIRIAYACRDRFGRLYAAGISIMFLCQAFINIGVAIGLIPSTGQTLPFVSAGGTSLLIYMVFFGVLLNISKDTSFAQDNKTTAVTPRTRQSRVVDR